jgi:hypothetical protein
MKQQFCFALLAILFALTGRSQVATGNIRGTIVDQTQAVLPNCSLTIVKVRKQ